MADSRYGWSVATTGDVILVGARQAGPGYVYIYERNHGDSNNWGETKKLAASEGVTADQFGQGVSISVETIVVGAARDDDNGDQSGSAYIFERNHGGANNWGQVKKLTASDGGALDQFGSSLAVISETMVVGAPDENSKPGASYVFERNQDGLGNWGEGSKFVASDPGNGNRFGTVGSISKDTLVVGARRNDDDGADSGSIYLFQRASIEDVPFSEVSKLTAGDAAAGDEFGHGSAIDGDTIVVGARLDDENGTHSGSVYVLGRDHGGTNN